MASAADVVLRSVHATPSTVVLYAVQTTPEDRSAYDVYLYEVNSTPSTVVLRRVPGVAETSGGTTWQGDASVGVAVTVAAAGTRVRLGDAATSTVFSTVAEGRRVRLGDASAAVALTTAADGVRFRLGVASAAVAFTTSADGLRLRLGDASAEVAFTTSADAFAIRGGSASAAVAFTASASALRYRFSSTTARIEFFAVTNPYPRSPLMATVRLAISLTVSDAALDTDSTAPVMIVEKTIAGLNAYSQKRLLVNNTTKTLWSATAVGEALTSFSFLAIWCDTTSLELELTCNDGDAAEAISTVSLAPGVPFFLGADESRYNPGSLSGTADVIDLIRVKNAAATDAVVNMVYAA